MKIFDTLIEIVYPKRCLFCNKVIITEGSLCVACEKKIDEFRYYGGSNTTVLKCIISPFVYQGGVRNAVIQFKFKHQKQYGINICNYMIEAIKENGCEFDVVVSIPMYWISKLERGFNQSEILAKKISNEFAKPFIKGCLVKSKATYEQHTLDAKERADNLVAAYKIRKADRIMGKRILLVDDVCTTGITLRKGASILIENGAISVIGVVIARSNSRVI